jgi:hypothetical protein
MTYRRILGRMGYYNYQNGLIYNHLNQEGGWDRHLGKCRQTVLQMIDLYNPQKVTILGSGWLLDLPLAELMERSCRVVLVDIIHPPEVVKQAGDLDNVELVETDITGGLIEAVWKAAGKFTFFRHLKSADSLIIPEFDPGFDPGFVISLNILTQLETLLVACLRKGSRLDDGELLRFRKAIQEKHIGFLRARQSLLITDYEEVETKKSGESATTPTLLAELPGARPLDEWTWDFDLKGHENYNSTIVIHEKAVAW